MSKSTETLAAVCRAIEEKQGQDVVILDIRNVSSFSDYFVICHGMNRKQTQAISDGIQQLLKKQVRPSHVEGYRAAEWILMDYLDFIIHIFSEESREFYKIEKLWSDGVELTPEALTA